MVARPRPGPGSTLRWPGFLTQIDFEALLCPIPPLAAKRVRQNKKRRALNRWRKDNIKDQVRSFLTAVQARDVATAEAEYRKTCGLLDKISTTSTLHKNTAARRKSRLARRLNELKKAK